MWQRYLVAAIGLMPASALAQQQPASPSIEKLLSDGWEIAGYISAWENRSLILFRHKDQKYLVQCSVLIDVMRNRASSPATRSGSVAPRATAAPGYASECRRRSYWLPTLGRPMAAADRFAGLQFTLGRPNGIGSADKLGHTRNAAAIIALRPMAPAVVCLAPARADARAASSRSIYALTSCWSNWYRANALLLSRTWPRIRPSRPFRSAHAAFSSRMAAPKMCCGLIPIWCWRGRSACAARSTCCSGSAGAS